MRAEQPQIAGLADRRPRRRFHHGIGRVVTLRGRILEGAGPQIDLANLETGDLNVEVESDQRERLELLAEQPVVPGRDLGQPIIGDRECAGLHWAQVIEAQRRHLGNANFTGGQHSPMASDDVAVTIDQDRDDEAKGLEAFANLPNLLPGMAPRVGGIRFQLLASTIHDF
jgi:hypothetical protein